MNYADNNRQQEALANWLKSQEFTVFGTLKFTDGYSISGDKAEANIRQFFNKLDKTYLGSKIVDAGHRIERAVFRHMGKSGGNLHFHFLARPTKNVADFCETAKCVWDETSTFTMGYEHTMIDGVKSSNATANYIVHEFQNLGADSLYLPATHSSHSVPIPKPLHAMRRLLKRQERNEKTREAGLTRYADRASKTG